ncbi:MAG: type II secretion system minor pseudopilin GspJ [Porticoccaceae bacterium]|nr:type II secretion system minor pseudopilin GspJ [Porticoccaceae bacterium]
MTLLAELQHSRGGTFCPVSARGFTLVEILVSMLIMSVLSVLAYNAFDGILRLEARSKEQFLEENRRSLASSIMLNDFFHMRPRPVRDQLGGVRDAYLAPSGEYAVEFTRGGLPDFDYMGGGIQRLAYRVENQQLIRTSWRTADSGATPETLDQVLATGIAELRVEQHDGQNQFVALWPPVNQGLSRDALPAMVRITLVTVDGEEQVMLVPGLQTGVDSGAGS